RNTAMDVLREKKRVDDISYLLNQEEPETEEDIDLGETEKMLANLEPLDREIVVMKAVLECSFEEISSQLGLALSASKMRYYRALDRLKSEITL
ncbi:MAG: sigma factor-like helix-turn-helix DNA-binding protein, partial [Paraglaciecola chathamensis]